MVYTSLVSSLKATCWRVSAQSTSHVFCELKLVQTSTYSSKEILMTLTQTTQTWRPFPQAGEVFELTATKELTGLGLVAYFGFYPDRWQFTGKTVTAGTTKRFRLVEVGYQPNLAAVAKVCTKPGQKVPEGVWMQTFSETFGSNIRDRNIVGVADSSWVNPRGLVEFPLVYKHSGRSFSRADNVQDDDLLWLVEEAE